MRPSAWVVLGLALALPGAGLSGQAPGAGAPTGLHAEASALLAVGAGAGGFGGGLGVRGGAAGHRVALRLKLAADLSGFPDSGGGQETTRFSITWRPPGGLGPLPDWLSVGASYLRFEECPGADGPVPDPCDTPGLAAEVDWGRRVTGLGVGGHAFADLNPRAPLLGVSFDVRVGWFR